MKTLIISHNSLSNHANNGKTLTSFFAHRDAEEIAQLYFQDEIPESEKFNKYFRLRDVDIAKSLLSFKSKPGSEVLPKVRVLDHHVNSSSASLKLIKILKKFNLLKKIVREFLYHRCLGGLRGVDEWTNKIKPDAIFLMGSEYPFLYHLGTHIALKYKIPLFVYITDDYILNYKRKGFLNNHMNSKLRHEIGNAVRLSKGCFVIGNDMAKAYSREFAVKFDVLCNSISFAQPPKAKKYIKKRDISIIYAGGLTLGRSDMLCEFMTIARLAAQAADLNIQLIIYSQDVVNSRLAIKFNEGNIKFFGKLDKFALGKELVQADYLLHVESDVPEYVEKTKLSISTKIPEYLATGVCVIAFGPAELSSIRLFDENKIGVLVDSRRPEQIKIQSLSDAFTKPDLCNELAKNGCNYVYSNFNTANTARLIDQLIFDEQK